MRLPFSMRSLRFLRTFERRDLNPHAGFDPLSMEIPVFGYFNWKPGAFELTRTSEALHLGAFPALSGTRGPPHVHNRMKLPSGKFG
jgi:hypothetical protein